MPAEQLKMFMTGPEIKSYAEPGNGEYLSSDTHEVTGDVVPAKLWKRKLKEATASNPLGYVGGNGSLASSIARKGVQAPVEIMHGAPKAPRYDTYPPQVGNGHHRVAVASALHPDQFLPVVHHESSDNVSLANWRAQRRADGYSSS